MANQSSFKLLIKSDFIVELGQRTELDFKGALYFEFGNGLNIGGFLELNQPWQNPLGYSNIIVNRCAIQFDYKTLPVPSLNIGLLADITLRNLTGYGAVGFQLLPYPMPKMVSASICDTDLAEIIEAITGESPPLAWILSKLRIVGVEPFNSVSEGNREVKKGVGKVTKIYDLVKDQIVIEKDRGVKKFLSDSELKRLADKINEIFSLGFSKDNIVVFEGRRKLETSDPKGHRFFRIEGKENIFEIVENINKKEEVSLVKINEMFFVKNDDNYSIAIQDEQKIKVLPFPLSQAQAKAQGKIQENSQNISQILKIFLEILDSERITKSPRILDLKANEVSAIKIAFSHNNQIQVLKSGYENFQRGSSSLPKLKIPLGEDDRIYLTKVKEKRDIKNDRDKKYSIYYLADGPNV
jgi:hypothetical protein